MNGEFSLSSELVNNNTLIMRTDGYINNIGGEKIVSEFNRHESYGINKVILDLKSSRVVNSIGVSYLIEVIELLGRTNGKMIFTNLDPTIEKTFKIMGLFQVADKAESLDAALI